MRKFMLAGFALCAVSLCQASLPEVASVEKVNLPQGMTVGMATISPDGSYAVVSPMSYVGLQRIDLSNGNVTEISKTGSPMMLQISSDGSNVVYRESSYDNSHRRFVALKAYNNADGTTTTLVEPSRNLQGFAVDGLNAVAIENGRKMSKQMRGTTAAQSRRATLSISQGMIYVTRPDGSPELISPLGNQCGSYLWPELSPDGSRIVAFGVGTGAFVCDLDGSNVTLLGMYRAPQWLDNNTIVAMDDYDDGVKTVKSSIMALSADGSEKAALTGTDVVATFPTPATGKVAFTTPDGELYIINLK